MGKKWQDKIVFSPKMATPEPATDLQEPAIIMLVTGEDTEGHPQWAYARIPADQFAAFKAAEEKGAYILSDFGTILKSGRGKTPTEDVKKAMREQYGCDENFENSLAEMVQEAIDAWDQTLSEEENNKP